MHVEARPEGGDALLAVADGCGMAEAHRGSVRVLNTGDGCCFEMRLPACR